MAGEIYIYISSVCGVVFYLIEFYTARETYKNLYFVEKREDNKIINFYSIRLRICNLLYDFSMMNYNHINNMQSAFIVFLTYFCADMIIFSIRSYYAYVLQYKIKNTLETTSVENPIHEMETKV